MKKLIAWAIALGGLMSCQKGINEAKIAQKENISPGIANGHLVFKSAEEYNQLLVAEKPGNIISSLKGSEKFVSMADRNQHHSQTTAKVIRNCDVPDSLIDNNQTFFSILDENGVVQIDTELYRYDYCGDRVWVISATNAGDNGYYTDFLNGVERTSIVGYFPSYVDAIEAVAEGYTTMPDESTVQDNEVFERPGFLFGPSISEHFWVYNNPRDQKEENLFDGQLAYDKFAIYFHFYGKEKYRTPCVFNWCTSMGGPRDWQVAFQYKYRRKGRSYDESGSAILDAPLSGENKVDKTFYEGNRGLKSGSATWDVNHVFANWVSLERYGGFGWVHIFSQTFPGFVYTNNWPFVGNPPVPMHYSIKF